MDRPQEVLSDRILKQLDQYELQIYRMKDMLDHKDQEISQLKATIAELRMKKDAEKLYINDQTTDKDVINNMDRGSNLPVSVVQKQLQIVSDNNNHFKTPQQDKSTPLKLKKVTIGDDNHYANSVDDRDYSGQTSNPVSPIKMSRIDAMKFKCRLQYKNLMLQVGHNDMTDSNKNDIIGGKSFKGLLR